MFEYIKTDSGMKFSGTLSKRAKTEGIVVHHLAGYGSVREVNSQEIRDNGWKAIGYNIYIRMDGSAWWGRGLDAVGSHAGRKAGCPGYADGAHNNDRTIGIGCEGYYHPRSNGTPDKTMPIEQYTMLVKIIRDLQTYYGGGLYVKGHKEMPGTNTVCPGDYFPLAPLKNAVAYTPVTRPAGNTKQEKTIPVKRLQTALKADGHDCGATDGIWGKKTEAAAKSCIVKFVKPWQNMASTALAQEFLGVIADGKCGEKTTAAIKLYQQQHGLTADGIIGLNTWRTMCGK